MAAGEERRRHAVLSRVRRVQRRLNVQVWAEAAVAPTWGGDGKWFMKAVGGGSRTHRLGKTSIRKGGNLIEYEDEDPAIREMFDAELRKNGVEGRMPSRKAE